MTEVKSCEVHGILHNGERVYLGSVRFDMAQAEEMLENIATAYSRPDAGGWFHIKSSIYDVKAFAGVQITPPFLPEERKVSES